MRKSTLLLHPEAPFIGYVILHIWAIAVCYSLRGWVHALFFAFAPFNFLYWAYKYVVEIGVGAFPLAVVGWIAWSVVVVRKSRRE